MRGRALKADAHIALPAGSLSARALRLQSSVRANARDQLWRGDDIELWCGKKLALTSEHEAALHVFIEVARQ